MSDKPQDRVDAPIRGARAGELAAVALGLFVFFGLQVWVSGAASLLTQYFWYDEILTHAVVNDPDPLHAWRAVADGVETHPPAYYALLRAYATLVSSGEEMALRSFSCLSTLLAFLGLYAALREGFRPGPALAAVASLGCHTVVVHYAFEARCYSLLFASSVGVAYLLLRARRLPPGVATILPLWATTVLLCTTHYFGILGLTLILAADALFAARDPTRNRVRLLTMVVGLVALGGCIPLMRQQRAALTVATWLEPTDAAQVLQVFRSLLFPGYYLILLGLLGLPLLVVLVRQRKRNPGTESDLARVAAVLGLLGFPVVLLVMSFTYQPVLLERYALPCVAGLTPPVAYLAARLNKWVPPALGVVFFLVGVVVLRNTLKNSQRRDGGIDQLQAVLKTHCPGEAPLAFQRPLRLFMIHRYAPDLAPRCFLLDAESGEVEGARDEFFFGRDLARRYTAYYGRPGLLTIRELLNHPRAYVVYDNRQTTYKGLPGGGARRRLTEELDELRRE